LPSASPVPAPVNDLYADAIPPSAGSTVGATRETDEPVPGYMPSASIWYKIDVPEGATLVSVRGPVCMRECGWRMLSGLAAMWHVLWCVWCVLAAAWHFVVMQWVVCNCWCVL
jgi:hypothetical protein